MPSILHDLLVPSYKGVTLKDTDKISNLRIFYYERGEKNCDDHYYAK